MDEISGCYGFSSGPFAAVLEGQLSVNVYSEVLDVVEPFNSLTLYDKRVICLSREIRLRP